MTTRTTKGESKPTARRERMDDAPLPNQVTKGTKIRLVKRDMEPRDLGLRILSRFYMGEADLEMARRRVLHRENRKIGDVEAVLALLTDLIRNADDPQMKAQVMEGIAEFQSSIGQDPRPVLAEMHRMELQIFKDLGFERVSIDCKKDACPTCRKQANLVLGIEKAIEDVPLPHPACTNLPHSKARPFCRCRFYGEYRG